MATPFGVNVGTNLSGTCIADPKQNLGQPTKTKTLFKHWDPLKSQKNGKHNFALIP